MDRVMIHTAAYDSLKESIDLAFRLFPLDFKNKKVLIKPNVLRSSQAVEGIVTNPAVLKAVVEKVKSLSPASLIVGDNPGVFSYGANEESFRSTELMDASLGHYMNIGTDSVSVKFGKYGYETLSVSRAIMEADIVISLPKFKTHGLTVISGAIKNSYGILPGAQKAKLHRAAGNPQNFHELIVEVFKLRVPDLFIVDAVIGMEGNGPASPDLRNIGRILASDNAVALDSVIASMMGLDPGKLRFLQKAKEYGLGDYDLSKIEIHGELFTIPDYKIPPLGGDAVYNNQALQDMMHKRTQVLPQADHDKCTSCQSCVAHCPVSALYMDGAIPVVKSDTCIQCFCCQEICPEKAITLR